MKAFADEVLQAAQTLARGELLGLPTETVYGLAADALNPSAVQAIFQAKGRPANHPLIVHIRDAAELGAWRGPYHSHCPSRWCHRTSQVPSSQVPSSAIASRSRPNPTPMSVQMP